MKDGSGQKRLDELTDGISAVRFAKEGTHLVVTSWDGSASVYETEEEKILRRIEHKAPQLSCDWIDNDTFVVGGLDRKHDDAVSCLRYASVHSLLISGSWDRTIRLTDQRARAGECATLQVTGKVFAMDQRDHHLVVALSDRQNWLWDLRKLETPLQKRTSSLRYTTRSVACMPNGTGYATSSVEGRIAVEFFDQDPQIQSQAYAFKCHRQQVDEHDAVYPVNALAFHPLNGTFVSGGGDGHVSVWDPVAKKRKKQYPAYDSGISSLDFSQDGTRLAIASSDPYVDGKLKSEGTAKTHTLWLRTTL